MNPTAFTTRAIKMFRAPQVVLMVVTILLNFCREVHAELAIGSDVAVVASTAWHPDEGAADSSAEFAAPGYVFCVEKVEQHRIQLRSLRNCGWVDLKAVASLADAEVIFGDWIAQRTNLAAAYFGRGQILEVKGQTKAAIADLTQAIQIERENADYRIARGKAYLRSRQYRLAESDFTESIRFADRRPDAGSRTDCGDAYYHRGITWYEQNRLDQAISDFDAALRCVPRMALALNRRGMARRKLGALKEALADFEQAIASSPSFSAPRNSRALTLVNLGRYREGIDEFERAVALAPREVFTIGTVSHGLHSRLSQAGQSQVQEYWQLDAELSIQNNLAQLLLRCPDARLRNPKRALALAAVLRERDHGRYFEFLKTEAEARAAVGELERAIELLQEATKAAPPDQQNRIQERIKQSIGFDMFRWRIRYSNDRLYSSSDWLSVSTPRQLLPV